MLGKSSPVTEEEALKKLAALCARTEYCTGDLDEKMRRWGLDEEARMRNIDYLVNHQYVDNMRYCQAFVNDKIKYNKWGRRKIEQALWAKHISVDIAKTVLDHIDSSIYMDILKPLLKAKWPTIHAKNDYERSMKLIQFAMGRGFETELIRRCIDQNMIAGTDES